MALLLLVGYTALGVADWPQWGHSVDQQAFNNVSLPAISVQEWNFTAGNFGCPVESRRRASLLVHVRVSVRVRVVELFDLDGNVRVCPVLQAIELWAPLL